ncbi:hypothetical protein [Gillisia sp. Hel_I_86]|nr:hypothetical protein [Gillisia sp. Hel_I_86]
MTNNKQDHWPRMHELLVLTILENYSCIRGDIQRTNKTPNNAELVSKS